MGVIEAVNRSNVRSFTQRELEFLTALAVHAAIAVENAQLHAAEREQYKLVQEAQMHLGQQERLAGIGRLTASLAHELNNPLQAIHNSLEMLLAFPLDETEQRTYLGMADEEVLRLIEMVGRILDFSRRPTDGMVPVDLNSVVTRVLDLSRKFLQHRYVSVNLLLSDAPLMVYGNAAQLGQVFLNLVINAVDAMSDGGTLGLRSDAPKAGQVRVSVSDTGHGIPPDQMVHIFQPFFTTKANGTGLGLSICDSIIREHYGEIRVRSEVAKGAVFEVWLPVLEESAQDIPTGTEVMCPQEHPGREEAD